MRSRRQRESNPSPLLEPNRSTLTGGGLDTLPGRMSMQQRDGGGPPFGSESFHTAPTVIGRMLGQCRLVGRDTSGADCSVGVDLMTLIDVRPGVRGGKPCFVATRITVYDVLGYLASGMTAAEIVADFPELTTDHVRAALAFAALREHRLATPA